MSTLGTLCVLLQQSRKSAAAVVSVSYTRVFVQQEKVFVGKGETRGQKKELQQPRETTCSRVDDTLYDGTVHFFACLLFSASSQVVSVWSGWLVIAPTGDDGRDRSSFFSLTTRDSVYCPVWMRILAKLLLNN